MRNIGSRLLALLSRAFGGIRKGDPPMHDPIVVAGEHIDPQAVLLDAEAREREAERALERLRTQYHAGTDTLTVAQAKVEVMQRYPSYGRTRDEGGEWHHR